MSDELEKRLCALAARMTIERKENTRPLDEIVGEGLVEAARIGAEVEREACAALVRPAATALPDCAMVLHLAEQMIRGRSAK